MRKGRAFEMEAVLFGIIVACHLLLRDGSVWFIVVWKHTPAETYYIFLICTHAKTDGCSWYTANLCHWPFSGFQGTVGPWNLQKIAEDLRMAFDEGSSFEIYAGRAWCGDKLEQGSWKMKGVSHSCWYGVMESDKKQQLVWGCWFLIVNVLDITYVLDREATECTREIWIHSVFSIIGLGQCHASSRGLSKRENHRLKSAGFYGIC